MGAQIQGLPGVLGAGANDGSKNVNGELGRHDQHGGVLDDLFGLVLLLFIFIPSFLYWRMRRML